MQHCPMTAVSAAALSVWSLRPAAPVPPCDNRIELVIELAIEFDIELLIEIEIELRLN